MGQNGGKMVVPKSAFIYYYRREQKYAVPIGYAFKGYSLQSSSLRNMLDQILRKCFEVGLYVPVVSFDGQWARLAVRSKEDAPLTMLQLQKDVFAEARAATGKDILDIIKNTNVVHAVSMNDVFEQVYGDLTISCENHITQINLYRSKTCKYMFKTSDSVRRLLTTSTNKRIRTNKESDNLNEMRDTVSPEIAESLEDDILLAISETNLMETRQTEEMQVDIGFIFDQDTDERMQQDVEDMDTDESGLPLNIPRFNENTSAVVPKTVNLNISQPTNYTFEDTQHVEKDGSQNVIELSDSRNMLDSLQAEQNVNKKKWAEIDVHKFNDIFRSEDHIHKEFTKKEMLICLDTVSEKLKKANIKYMPSWKKDKFVSFFFKLIHGQLPRAGKKERKRRLKVSTLKDICFRVVKKYPKRVLLCVYAEFLYPGRLEQWRKRSPFEYVTQITGSEISVAWYSMPEYVEETFTYLFQLLDAHHLFVNSRLKCCSTGIKERGINREAWVKVAKKSSDNKSGLSVALVNDLVDRQSSAFAQKTFSVEVEKVMRQNGDNAEANFCKILREWYEAEDNPGLDVMERIRRRLKLREWLLCGVDFSQFPPYGTHVLGVPYVMFEGLMTNVERRIQIIPYVKTGAYNPRALGSLEAENFFGEFQDLDPKGSGVIRPEDIPKAISTACELIEARLDPTRCVKSSAY